MFTNVNTKSLKGFIQSVLQNYYPKVLGSIVVVYTIGTLLLVTQNIYTRTPTGSLDLYQFTKGFYERQIGRASTSVKLVGIFSKSESAKEEILTGESLYRSYISEIVETKYPVLDEDTVAAIVYHESRFQPDSVNKKTNATGLMQILPKWHMERAQNLGVTDLSDPYGNIIVGCDILNEIYQQNHSMDYALDFYAGGYRYADRYKNSVSPYRQELNEILQEHILGKE